MREKESKLQEAVEDISTLQKNAQLLQQTLQEVEEARLLGEEERSLMQNTVIHDLPTVWSLVDR